MTSVTLIISTYNWPSALDLVLRSVMAQTVMPLEVLIADDGSREETAVLIRDYAARFPVPLKHIWHEDNGFRKTVIMNMAVKHSSGDYLVQIDGDIILHPDFIKDHIHFSAPGYFIKGSRGRLKKDKSEEVLASKDIRISPFDKGVQSRINATHLPFLSPLFYGRTDHSRNVKGCNFALWKSDFIAVNGYNNNLKGWGHEDIELAARLINYGIKRRQLKLTAVCYHIYHELLSRNDESSNLEVYYEVVKQKLVRCENGYDQV